jgi:hypothetical protein
MRLRQIHKMASVGEMVKRCASLRSMNGWPVWQHGRAELITCPRKPEKHESRLPA